MSRKAEETDVEVDHKKKKKKNGMREDMQRGDKTWQALKLKQIEWFYMVEM